MTARQDSLPDSIRSDEELEDLLSRPTEGVVEALGGLDGDIVVLGAGGKMGPTLARMAKRASDAAASPRRVIAVSRFRSGDLRRRLESWGIQTITCDLLDEDQVQALPAAANVIFMAGMKFGATGNEPLTWAMNTYLPAIICRRYRRSRIVSFSTGNIYGLVPICGGGSVETDLPDPIGEYAMSCLGRERMFEYFSGSLGIPMAIIRLNYAVELRYGVVVDVARRIQAGEPIDLTMGCVNIIWQGDANAMVLQSLARASRPALVLNVAGPELLSVRRLGEQLARLMDREVHFTGNESGEALISNGQLGHELFGYPRVSVGRMLRWIADWVGRGGRSLDKPTHFETRDGRY